MVDAPGRFRAPIPVYHQVMSVSTQQDTSEQHAEQALKVLSELGCGYLESGLTPGQAKRSLERCGRALGLSDITITPFARVLLLETRAVNGSTDTITAAARSLDMIDCTRSKELGDVAAQLEQASPRGSADYAAHLDSALSRIRHLREMPTPWWVVAIGMTMLAFFISMQVGITWHAWVSAAIVQLVISLVGRALTVSPRPVPGVFAVALQASVGGSVATLLVQLGFVDPVGAAAAIAVSWLLLLPLPQVIGAVTDALEADYLSSLTRLAGVLVAALGIFIGGSFTFVLGELLHMDHPRLDGLPSFPWYLVLVFSALGAISNAFANGGTVRLLLPAAFLGVSTGAVNQTLLNLIGLPPLWANSLSAVALGVLTVLIAPVTGYPLQVLALMGITGALLPGIPVFYGILQEMSGASGLVYFGAAGAICIGLGTGVALGSYLASLWQRQKQSNRRHW